MKSAGTVSKLGPPGSLARPDWQPDTAIAATDLRLEQSYFLQRARRHLRLVHGSGVVCGLNVVPAPGGQAGEFIVCPGYGISPCGDEILVPCAFHFNLKDFLWTRPLDVRTDFVWIQIEAYESPAAYRAAASPACGCGSPHEEVSRLADGFRIVVAWTQPPAYRSEYDLCGAKTPPCPACPETCGLTLAGVILPDIDGN